MTKSPRKNVLDVGIELGPLACQANSLRIELPRPVLPQGGLGVKIYYTFKVFSTFLLWKQLKKIVSQTWLNLVTLTCGSWSQDLHGLYFTVQWPCLNLEDYLMYEHYSNIIIIIIILLIINYSSGLWVSTTRRLTSKQMYITVIYILWYIDFVYLLRTMWSMNIILCDHESMTRRLT